MSSEDSHVRTSAQLEREQASPEQSPVCGRKWHALSVRFDLFFVFVENSPLACFPEVAVVLGDLTAMGV